MHIRKTAKIGTNLICKTKITTLLNLELNLSQNEFIGL